MNRRTFSIRPHTRADDPADDDVFSAVLSSDAAIDRGGYTETLSHKPGAVDLRRQPLPLLEVHDNSKVNIGNVSNLRLDGGKLRGDVRFGSSVRAKELMTDIRSGIVRSLSIGYSIDDYELDEDRNVTATRWTPMETSIVPVPADIGAGFFRSQFSKGNTMNDEDTSAGGEGLTRSQRQFQRRTADAERQAAAAAANRAADIAALAQRHGMSDRIAGWLASGFSETQIREEIMESMATDPRTMIRASSGAGDPMFQPDTTRTRSQSDPIPREELRKCSLIRAIRSQVMTDNRHATREAGFELEISRTLADFTGRSPKGLMVPDELFFASRASLVQNTRTMSAGSASAGGDLVAQNLLAEEFIETLDNQPQVFALGARRLAGLVGNVAIPRMTTGSAVAWLSSEGGTYNSTQPVFDQPTMTPHDLAAYTTITRRLLIQSTPAADDLVRNDLAKRIGIGIDAAVINGTGSSGQPTGILNTSGVSVVPLGANGSAPSWAAITNVIEDVAAANGLRGNLGWLTNGPVMGTLLRTAKQSGYPTYVWEPSTSGRPDEGQIAGFKALVSNSVPANLSKGTTSGTLSSLIFGNWSDLLVGFWRGIDLIVDPYTLSTSGSVQISAVQTCDVLIRHPLSFCMILDAVTT